MDIVATMSCDDEGVVQKKDRGLNLLSDLWFCSRRVSQCLKTDGIPVVAMNDR